MGKNYKLALEDARKCLELGSTEASSAHLKIALCCVVFGLVEEGRDSLRKVAQNSQTSGLAEKLDHIETFFNQAVVFADDKKYAEAEMAIDRLYCILSCIL